MDFNMASVVLMIRVFLQFMEHWHCKEKSWSFRHDVADSPALQSFLAEVIEAQIIHQKKCYTMADLLSLVQRQAEMQEADISLYRFVI